MILGRLETAHPEVVAKELRTCRCVFEHGGLAEPQDGPTHHEDQSSPGPQQPCRLLNPSIRVAPDARAIFADGEVKRRIPDWDPFRVAEDERE